MATIRIPVSDEPIQTPNPRAGTVGVRLTPALRDPRAGQMDTAAGQRRVPLLQDVDAAAGIGRAAGQIASKIDQLVEAENRMADDTAVRQGRTAYLSRLGEVETEFQGRDVRNSAEARAEFDRRGGEIRDELGREMTPRARQQFALVADELLVMRSLAVGRDAFTRGAQAAVATLQESTRDLANRAAAARTPEERAVLLQQGQNEIAQAVSNGYMNPEAAGRMARGFRQDVQMADVNRLIGTSPAAAIALLNDPSRTADIDADRRQSLINAARTRQDAMAARAEAAAARRETVATRALAEWDNLAATGIVPPERAERTLALARGTTAEPIVRQRIAQAGEMERFRVALPQQQQAMLAEAEGRARSPNASDRDLQQVQRMVQTADQQRRGYAQDGWMQGVRDGLVDRSEVPPPLNLADPQTIIARYALADRLSTTRGYTVPALSAAETADLARQFVQAQGNPALVAQVTAAINQIPDQRIREATFRQLEAARGDAGRMERGTLPLIGDLAGGSPAQQRAAVQVTQAVTGDRSERVRRTGESTELNAALESALSTPTIAAAQAASAIGRDQATRFNAQLGAVRDLAASHMAAGATPSDAVRRAVETVFADQTAIHRPGLAQLYYDRSLNLGPPDMVERTLRGLRDRFVQSIPLDPAAGAETNQRNRDLARVAGQAEWRTVGPGEFALVGRGDFGQMVILQQVTADQLRNGATAVQRQRATEQAPRPPGEQRTGRLVPERGPTDAPPADAAPPVVSPQSAGTDTRETPGRRFRREVRELRDRTPEVR